jgi:hypothetical protein
MLIDPAQERSFGTGEKSGFRTAGFRDQRRAPDNAPKKLSLF